MTEKHAKIRPLKDNLVIEAVNEMAAHSSGIIIPDTVSKGKPKKGKVVAVGKGKFDNNGKLIPMDVKVGDLVLLKDWGPTEIKVDGKELYILEEGDVLAILE